MIKVEGFLKLFISFKEDEDVGLEGGEVFLGYFKALARGKVIFSVFKHEEAFIYPYL